jgi:hypothetical protein
MTDVYHVESLTALLKSLKAPTQEDEPSVVLRTHEVDPTAVTKAVDVAVPPKVTAKNVFRHPISHPLVLDLLLIDKYGEEWLGWESETIERRVPQDFSVDRISDLNMSKINAVKTLHLVDTFWQRWEVFTWCTMPLNAIFPDFQYMQVPTVLQSMLSVDIANRIRSEMEWSSEIKEYLAVVHRHDGILVPQPPLAFVEVDTSGLPLDIADVIARWPAVRVAKSAPRADTPEDEQLRRMLSLFLLLEEKRVQLRQQLEVLRG